jgi:hypothetical protein
MPIQYSALARAALRIVLEERAERVDRGGEVVAPEEVRRASYCAHLARLLLAVGRRGACGRGRGALAAVGGGARPVTRAPAGSALEALQPRVEVEVEVALALLDLLVLVGEHLQLPAQARDLAFICSSWRTQLDHADVADHLLEARDARLVVAALLEKLLSQCSMRRRASSSSKRPPRGSRRGGEAAPPRREPRRGYSPGYLMSARRFCAHDDSSWPIAAASPRRS